MLASRRRQLRSSPRLQAHLRPAWPIRKSPGIFAYNENKQAFVKNPRGGSFRDLVAAAESCTAKIIHPGLPWNSAEPDLEGLRERARAFA